MKTYANKEIETTIGKFVAVPKMVGPIWMGHMTTPVGVECVGWAGTCQH